MSCPLYVQIDSSERGNNLSSRRVLGTLMSLIHGSSSELVGECRHNLKCSRLCASYIAIIRRDANHRIAVRQEHK